jgi:NADH dehydrogenase
MKVTVFGGTGFVGSYLIDELLRQGHHPVLLVRPGSKHRVNQSAQCTLVEGDIGDPNAIGTVVAGADAVIYNIGILREFPAQGVTFEALHFEGARRVMDIALEKGVHRFLLMSANGVKAEGTGYQRSKYMAEDYLKRSALDWTIFRPSVLFGDPRGRMEFATQLYHDIIRSPLPAPLFFEGLWPTAAGMFRMSPIHVTDVASMFVSALGMQQTVGQVFHLGGPDDVAWKDILQTIASAAGTTKWALPAPVLLLKGIASVLDQYEFFPITRDQLIMLMEGNTCDGQEACTTFGVRPIRFSADNLSYLTANQQV